MCEVEKRDSFEPGVSARQSGVTATKIIVMMVVVGMIRGTCIY